MALIYKEGHLKTRNVCCLCDFSDFSDAMCEEFLSARLASLYLPPYI